MRHRLTAALALISATSIGHAQTTTASPDDIAAFTALILTPAGALPQLVRVQRTMAGNSFGELALRYGRYNNFLGQSLAFSNIGVTGLAHFAKRVQVGGTVGHRSCSGCEGLTMGSIDAAVGVYHKSASGDTGGDTDVGLQVSAGMGKADSSDVSARSLTVSAPLAVSLPQVENSLLTLFVSPSLAYGRCENCAGNETRSGSRFMVGAGVGYFFAFGLSVQIEAHRIVIEDSPTQFGFALSYLFGGH